MIENCLPRVRSTQIRPAADIILRLDDPAEASFLDVDNDPPIDGAIPALGC